MFIILWAEGPTASPRGGWGYRYNNPLATPDFMLKPLTYLKDGTVELQNGFRTVAFHIDRSMSEADIERYIDSLYTILHVTDVDVQSHEHTSTDCFSRI